jgi:hypothetical protein
VEKGLDGDAEAATNGYRLLAIEHGPERDVQSAVEGKSLLASMTWQRCSQKSQGKQTDGTQA